MISFSNETPKGDAAELHRESDEVLMVRVAEGDSAAYETLYTRYKNRILTFVYRYVGDRDHAEDLTQEVFLKLYRNPRAFDPRSRFLTWLFAVARNLTIDQLRRKRPTASVGASAEEGENLVEPEIDSNQTPVELTLMHELESNMRDMLMSLSDKLREVFILCAMQGMSYEEVAQIVGCPAKTVSSRLSRAREKLMDGFGKYLEDARSRR